MATQVVDATRVAGARVADVTRVAGAHVASTHGQKSILVGILSAFAVYVGNKVLRTALRVRDWMRDFIFVRKVDWKSPQRQSLVLKDPQGWRKERVGIDVTGVVALLDLEWAAAVKKRDPNVDRHANPFSHIAPKASQGLQALVKKYQQTNVFLLADAASGKQERALLDFLESTRVLPGQGPGMLAHSSHVFVLDSRHLLRQAAEVAGELGLTDLLTSRPEMADALAPSCSGNVFLFADEPVKKEIVPKRRWWKLWSFPGRVPAAPTQPGARGTAAAKHNSSSDRAVGETSGGKKEKEEDACAKKGIRAGQTQKVSGKEREGERDGKGGVKELQAGGEVEDDELEDVSDKEAEDSAGCNDGSESESEESEAAVQEKKRGKSKEHRGAKGGVGHAQGYVEGSDDASRASAAAVRSNRIVYVGAVPKGWEVCWFQCRAGILVEEEVMVVEEEEAEVCGKGLGAEVTHALARQADAARPAAARLFTCLVVLTCLRARRSCVSSST